MKLDGKNIFITGGASGIGEAIARRFCDAGARVSVCDISNGALEATQQSTPEILTYNANVSVFTEVEAAILQASDEMGGLHVLINNAGIAGPKNPVDEIDPSEWVETIQANLNGAFFATKVAARIMKSQNAGCILNIGTTSVGTGLPNRSAYVASKAGLMGLTRSLARELGVYNIRCNAILPGAVAGERTRNILQQKAEKIGKPVEEVEADMLKYISMRSWINPSEIADAAAFLASDHAQHISGQFLGVCGNVEWEI